MLLVSFPHKNQNDPNSNAIYYFKMLTIVAYTLMTKKSWGKI